MSQEQTKIATTPPRLAPRAPWPRGPRQITRVRAGERLYIDVGVLLGGTRVVLAPCIGDEELRPIELGPGAALVLASGLERAVAALRVGSVTSPVAPPWAHNASARERIARFQATQSEGVG